MRPHPLHKNLLPLTLLPLVLLCALPGVTRASAPAAAAATDQKPQEFSVAALLDTALDSKKRNAGDEVQAKIVAPVKLNDGTLIPKGAMIVGHVTESKALGKGDDKSSLTLAFEKITTPDGKTLSIKGYLLAVGPSLDRRNSGGGVDYGTSLNRSMEHAGPGQQDNSAVPVLNEQSTGVEGIQHLGLYDGVLTSGDKSVKLEHNSQLVVRARIVPAQ